MAKCVEVSSVVGPLEIYFAECLVAYMDAALLRGIEHRDRIFTAYLHYSFGDLRKSRSAHMPWSDEGYLGCGVFFDEFLAQLVECCLEHLQGVGAVLYLVSIVMPGDHDHVISGIVHLFIARQHRLSESFLGAVEGYAIAIPSVVAVGHAVTLRHERVPCFLIWTLVIAHVAVAYNIYDLSFKMVVGSLCTGGCAYEDAEEE